MSGRPFFSRLLQHFGSRTNDSPIILQCVINHAGDCSDSFREYNSAHDCHCSHNDNHSDAVFCMIRRQCLSKKDAEIALTDHGRLPVGLLASRVGYWKSPGQCRILHSSRDVHAICCNEAIIILKAFFVYVVFSSQERSMRSRLQM